jgi:hypothetical protein
MNVSYCNEATCHIASVQADSENSDFTYLFFSDAPGRDAAGVRSGSGDLGSIVGSSAYTALSFNFGRNLGSDLEKLSFPNMFEARLPLINLAAPVGR